MAQTARIFMTGRSQAVRLPLEFRFNVDEVYIRRDESTGDVILSPKPKTWDEFFDLYSTTDVPEDYMLEAGSGRPEPRRDVFREVA